ncbi:hypothetical protein UlMin_035229 [Ulmus minor]
MAEIANYSVDNGFLGCGFMGGIFQRYWPRKSPVHSLPSNTSNNSLKPENHKKPPNQKPRRRGSTSSELAISEISNSAKHLPKIDENPTKNPSLVHPRSSVSHQKTQTRRLSDAARSSTSSSNGSGQTRTPKNQDSDDSKALVRANSGNVIPLGNLKQPGSRNSPASNSPNASKTMLTVYRNIQEATSIPKSRSGYGGGNRTMGNIVRKNSDEFRGILSKSDPDVLKRLGNDAYKQGRFKDALDLYDRAIGLDWNKAAYHSNKSAALIGLGRLVEAVFECEEAIRIEPSYHRAHHRLATLYLRLGEAEKALKHYKYSGSYANSIDVEKAQALQKCLNRCTEAQKLQNWNALLKETQFAISSGANSAPLVFALQAEALLKLLRHEEAYAIYRRKPNFSNDVCSKFFGLPCTAYILMIGSCVYLNAGRFENAVLEAQQAAQLDPNNKEINMAVKRARTVSSARSSGNLLFKAGNFSQASLVYSQGLEHDRYNSVLLCNRAACRSKLGQFEKAIEDCTAALVVQPSYSKARLRRADCNAKLERWEASIQDYELLIRETPGDEEVGRALFDAKLQLKIQRGEDTKDMKFESNLVIISNNERFRHIVTSPGMSVVLFCNKTKQKRVVQALEQVCKRFPSVNFLKVEIEDHPYLAKTEGVSSIPTFKIYKNGSRVKDIPGNNHELLESSVKWFSS